MAGLFYIPYALDPQATRTGDYLGDRIGGALLKNNLGDFLHFNIFYNSSYYVIFTGLLVLGYLGWALAFDGQSDEAIRHFELALRMSPHDPLKAFFYSGTGVAHYYAGRFDEAVEWARNAVRERPGFTASRRILCASLAQAGRTDETNEEMAALRTMQPNISIAWIEQHVPYTARAMPHFLEGMRKAGLS